MGEGEGDMLARVPLEELRDAWVAIRDRVEELRAEYSEPWLVEDVFHEILVGNAHLWTTTGWGGFVILQVFASPYERDLHVWIACNCTIARAAEYWGQVKRIAVENGCNRVTFESPRRGWSRALPGVSVRYVFSEEVE